jgi:hypothetical protein
MTTEKKVTRRPKGYGNKSYARMQFERERRKSGYSRFFYVREKRNKLFEFFFHGKKVSMMGTDIKDAKLNYVDSLRDGQPRQIELVHI